jgi:hypothetical protein
MADIKIDIDKLNSALTKLDTLVSSIDSQRKSAMSTTPTDLPSLSDENLGKTTTWLTEQKPELQTRLDLARLLDVDGDGQATYTVEHGDELWEVKRAVSNEMTNQLKNLDIDDVGSRERAALLASLLNRYQNDPDIPWQVMNALGPEGLTEVMNKLRNLTAQYGPDYWQYTDNPGAEHQAMMDLQESMGTGLAGMFSSASTYMDGEWGKKVAQDPWSASVLLRYIDKANRDLSPGVLEAMGVELKDREHNDPMMWSELFRSTDYSHFGNQDLRELQPMREYLNVADNSTRAAQAVMGNKELLKYFTSERQDWDHLSDQAGKVLAAATIDVATSDNYQYAMNAAEISSNLMFELGDKDKPLAGVKEEIGGVVATYIADADRVHDESGDESAGIHMWGTSPYLFGYGVGEESGLPKYGINLNQASLRNVLEDVGGNEAAMSAVGKATTIFNAARFDYGAAHETGEPPAGNGSMHKAAHESSSFVGFMTDALVNGDITDEETAAAERKKIATYFTAPLDLVKTDKLPVIGGLIKTEVKDAIIKGYTADKTPSAIAEANADHEASINLTTLQGLYSMEKYDVPTGLTTWPEDNGVPIPPEKLTKPQIQAIINQADGQLGVTSDVTGEIENTWDSHIKKYKK